MMVPIKITKNERGQEKKVRKSFWKTAGIVLIGLAVLVLLTAVLVSKTRSNGSVRQSVLTSTGQVYFGYVQNKNAEMVEIRDVYYLNSVSTLLNTKPEDKISLVKMGAEVYKPKNGITINRQHIIFIQDLSKDSQINIAIANSAGK